MPFFEVEEGNTVRVCDVEVIEDVVLLGFAMTL